MAIEAAVTRQTTCGVGRGDCFAAEDTSHTDFFPTSRRRGITTQLVAYFGQQGVVRDLREIVDIGQVGQAFATGRTRHDKNT